MIKVTVTGACGFIGSHLTTQLIELGFDVRDGKQGGHKIFVHQGLSAFYSGSFNCGHGKNPEIKPAYITKIIQILKQNQEALDYYLTRNL